MEDRYGGVSKSYICPVCRNRFQIPFQTKGGGKIQWVYKRKKKGKTIYYCTYHCFKDSEVLLEGGAADDGSNTQAGRHSSRNSVSGSAESGCR